MSSAFLLSDKGHRIRKCYLQSKIRYDEFVKTHKPIGAPWGEYQQWSDWCARRYGEILKNRDDAIEEALSRKREEKKCRRLQRRQRQRASQSTR